MMAPRRRQGPSLVLVRHFLFFGLGAFVLLIGDAAPAREKSDVILLERIMVEGAADNYGRLPESTATAGPTTTSTRLPIDSREIPQSIGVISEQLIGETAARNAQDLAPFVSGVSGSRTNVGDGGGLIVRGFEIGATSTVDGFRDPRVTSAIGTFRSEDLALYERVEILKGYSSVLYGRGNAGGTVNYVTKKPQFERAHSLEAGAASRDGYYRGVFDTTGPIGEDFAYRLIGVYQDSDFYSPGITDNRRIISPSFLWETPGGGDLFVRYEHSDVDFVAPYNAVLINGEVVEYNLYDPRNEAGERDADNIRLSFAQPLSSDWKLVMDGAYSGQDHSAQNLGFRPDSPVNPTQSVGVNFRGNFNDWGYGVRGELQGRLQLGPSAHKLAIGYDRYHRQADTLITAAEFGTFGEGPVFDPQFGAPLPPPFDPPLRFEDDADEQGIYLLDHMTLFDRVHLLGGVRYTEFEASDRINDVKTSDESALSPTLGGVYDFTDSLSTYASWSQSFDPNTGIDVTGNTFDPRRGEQYEVGLKATLSISASATPPPPSIWCRTT